MNSLPGELVLSLQCFFEFIPHVLLEGLPPSGCVQIQAQPCSVSLCLLVCCAPFPLSHDTKLSLLSVDKYYFLPSAPFFFDNLGVS